MNELALIYQWELCDSLGKAWSEIGLIGPCLGLTNTRINGYIKDDVDQQWKATDLQRTR